jgi:hypothetical protein
MPVLKWLAIGAGALIGIPLIMGLAFGGLALSHRARLWPAVRQVHARLQTDEGARDLFKKNPSLMEAYGTEQDFLETVHAWRGKVGGLPVQEPAEGPAYDLSLDPSGAEIRLEGQGGAWMRLELQGGTFAEPGVGEGLVRLLFAENEKGLEKAAVRLAEGRELRSRAEFREVIQQCSEESTARALYRQEPGLQAAYRSESAFLEHLRPMRASMAAFLAKPGVDPDHFHYQRTTSPVGRYKVYTFDQDAGELTARWENDRLSAIEGTAPFPTR